MYAEIFFNTLFHDKPASEHILIWELDGARKSSYWFNKVNEAIEHFRKQGRNQHTFVGCGTSPRALTEYQRCPAKDISGISAVWLDVDILNPVHSKLNLPETPEDAMKIIKPFPLKPTMTVFSGHGFQFWWVFNKFGQIHNDQQRNLAADFVHSFTWTMRDHAKSLGYDIDMTHDLSRVLRIPGGLNYKDTPPVQVVLKDANKNFYTIQELKDAINDFREWLGDRATPVGERKITHVASGAMTGKKFLLDPNANPPVDKFNTLAEFEPNFVASWEHRHRGFKSGDESASSYDLSLASYAFSAGWEEQEIVDLLIAFRRVNNLPSKLVEQYYERTLLTASNNVQKKRNLEDLSDVLIDLETMSEKTSSEQQATISNAKTILEKILNIRFRKVIEFQMNPKEYRLEMENGCIHLGVIQNLIEPMYFKRKIAEAVHVYLEKPLMKEDVWAKVVKALFHICVKEEVSDETNNKGQISTWLYKFLNDRSPLYDSTDGISMGRPFYCEDSLYFSLTEFKSYISRFCGEVIGPKVLGIMLKESGFQSVHFNVKNDNGKWATRCLWRIQISKHRVAHEFVNMELLQNANEIRAEAKKEKDKAEKDSEEQNEAT